MTALISETYIDNGKVYWRDAELDSELYYELDFTDWLLNEADSFVSVAWTVPAGLLSMHEYQQGDKLRIKLQATSAGEYEINCEMNSAEGADTQKKMVSINLKVS